MKFTDLSVDRLKIKPTRYEVWDGEGFGIRIAPSGKKTWVALYRFNGISKRLSYGDFPEVTVADARIEHSEAMKKLKKGIDPGEDKKLIKKINLEALTVNELVDEYLERWAKVRKTSWKEDQRILKGEVAKKWGAIKAKQLKRRDVIKFLDEIVVRAPVMANRTLAVLRRMFNFAIERDILEISPCFQIKMPSPEKPRERTLSDKEINIIWHDLDKTGLALPSILALKLELITAQRKGEVVLMEWEELSPSWDTWKISGAKTKNKKPHLVPLSKSAREILSIAREKINHEKWVFYSPNKDAHISDKSLNKAICELFYKKEQMAKASKNQNNKSYLIFNGVEKFTPHDLRRTASTSMTALGIPRFIVGKILNHTDKDNRTTGVYDLYEYFKEKKEALDLWSNRLMEIIK